MSQDAHQQGPFDELLGVLGELQDVLAEMKDTYEPEEMRYLDFLANGINITRMCLAPGKTISIFMRTYRA